MNHRACPTEDINIMEEQRSRKGGRIQRGESEKGVSHIIYVIDATAREVGVEEEVGE